MDEIKEYVESKQYIVIKIGDEQYGIDITFIDNIIRMTRITRVPKVANYIKGVINLRGEVIPVLSLRLKMYLPADTITNRSRILIIRTEKQGMIGFIVDEVREVVTLDADQISKTSRSPGEEDSHFISGVGQYNGTLISILDLGSITE
ncbi:MAG: chemotaxis protein CheW [Lachnospiraceae bacterium]|nr:chemotaxis protein CheW [Lachnospiraceae bacterium]